MTSKPRLHLIDPHPETLVNPDLTRLLCGMIVSIDGHRSWGGRLFRVTLDPTRATCKTCADLGRQLEMFP